MDGRETLREIRADPWFRGIRVVVMTTTKARHLRGADLSRPDAGKHWLEIVELPPDGNETPAP
ncbi:MAG: response regulator [Gemmataceae bacterium]|nr:response regulator [Gemmataceae bacterium]